MVTYDTAVTAVIAGCHVMGLRVMSCDTQTWWWGWKWNPRHSTGHGLVSVPVVVRQARHWLYHIQTVHTSLALKYLWSYKQILLTPNYWSPCIQIVHFTRTQNHFHSDTLFDCLESSPSRIILLIPILEYVMYGLALRPVYNKYCPLLSQYTSYCKLNYRVVKLTMLGLRHG